MKEIKTVEDWEQVKDESKNKRIFIFKHSNSCHTSTQVCSEIEQAVEDGVLGDPVYKIVVQESEEVSKKIASDTGVEHESPQIISLENGKSTYSASHGFIDPVVFSLNFE